MSHSITFKSNLCSFKHHMMIKCYVNSLANNRALKFEYHVVIASGLKSATYAPHSLTVALQILFRAGSQSLYPIHPFPFHTVVSSRSLHDTKSRSFIVSYIQGFKDTRGAKQGLAPRVLYCYRRTEISGPSRTEHSPRATG